MKKKKKKNYHVTEIIYFIEGIYHQRYKHYVCKLQESIIVCQCQSVCIYRKTLSIRMTVMPIMPLIPTMVVPINDVISTTGTGIFSGASGAEIRPHSQCNLGDFFPQFEKKKSQSKLIFFSTVPYIHDCEIQTLLFETVFSFDYKLLFNDSK